MRKTGMLLGTIGVTATAGALVVTACWAGPSRLPSKPEASRAREVAGRPKVLGIAYVKFKVTDVGKAKAFYESIGLPSVAAKNGNGVEASFAVNGYQRVDLAKTAPGTTGSYLVEIGLATDDLRKMRTYLTAKGVPAEKIMTWPDGISYFVTSDPEGNRILFVQEANWAKAGGPEGAISHKLIHAGFTVKDAKAENRFYEEVLGFHLYWHGGMKEEETNWMAMQVPDGTDWIEYMLNIPANADKHTLGVMNHISLGVPNVKEAGEELDQRGYGRYETPKIGRDGKWQLNLYDPDDTRVELMEFTPVEKPCCAEFTGPHPKP